MSADTSLLLEAMAQGHCALESLAKGLKLLVLDLDGVLTDGKLHYDAEGRITKSYCVYDGIGVHLLRQAGIEVAVITAGLDGPCVTKRMERLGITAFYEGNMNKQAALTELRERFGLEWHEMAFLGDDWVDLIPLALVGLPMAVANARPEVKDAARFVTRTPGGQGAVREVADWLLSVRNQKEAILALWSTPA